jgi:hypothetical protein
MRLVFLLAFISAAFIGCGPGTDADPLIASARTGDLDSLRASLQSGADPNHPGGVNGWPPLLHAIHKHQAASVRALLDGGADPNRPGRDGLTPLMMAAGYGYTEIVLELLRRGADPRVKRPDGTTALDMAVSGTPDIDEFTVTHCQTAAVRLLLEWAPDLKLGNSPLDRVAWFLKGGRGCAELRRLLGSRGLLVQ